MKKTSVFKIRYEDLDEVNSLMDDRSSPVIKPLLNIVRKYGTVKQINRKAAKSGSLGSMMDRLKTVRPDYERDVRWLIEQRETGRFVSLDDYCRSISGKTYAALLKGKKMPVILEISSLHYFPWIIEEAKQAIDKSELMPGRFIRVRNMKEQEQDGDLLAVSAAIDVLGASKVETLDTKGTDGSNVHLGGPDTITGYFGGVGEPNDYALKWADELLYYYTNYGVNEVLNVNPGTILIGYLLHKLGIDIRFKISVFMGNDNPYAALWTMIGAKLFSRIDGSTPLIGFNWSNSVNNETLLVSSDIRKKLGFDDAIRFEHHILEAYRHIVRQPYDRRDELLEIAGRVPNISAKHEGGEVSIEKSRKHQSSILDYFVDKKKAVESGLMPDLLRNYLDKHDAINVTARALVKGNLGFVAAKNVHAR